MFEGMSNFFKYERLSASQQESRSGSSSSSGSTYSDNIELNDVKVLRKQRLFYDEELEIEETLFAKCKLNLVLTAILCLALFLISLEFKFLAYRKQQPPDPIFNRYDFNDINPHEATWKLDTNEAYKLHPEMASHKPTTREYNFIVSSIIAAPDGVWKNLTVINGQFPAPLIECNAGDTLIINVQNEGIEPTTIHYHGIYQNGTNYYDGTSAVNQCNIGVGQKMTYKFKIDSKQWGTYWYHSHFSTQYADGLFGPLIIHSKEEQMLMKKKGQSYDEEVVVMFGDWYHNKGESYLPEYLASRNENTEPTPDNGLIQGSGVFNCDHTELECDARYSGRHLFQFEENKKYRMRLINAGFFAEVDFSVDNHHIEVVEGDGTNVETLELDVLRIAVAQRYSVILKTDQRSDSNLFYLRAKLNSFCFAYDNPNLDLDLKAVISVNPVYDTVYPVSNTIRANTSSYGHPNVRCRELNETLLVPLIQEPLPEMDQYFHIDSSFQIKAHAISLGYMNDVTYKPLMGTNSLIESIKYESKDEDEFSPSLNASLVSNFGPNNNQLVLSTRKVMTVDILINNYDDGSHPFHLHGYKFWVLKFGQGYFKPHRDYDSINLRPMKRDTVNISGFGYVLIRVVLDNPGIWPLHCHIGWHMEAGLAMQLDVMSDVYKTWDLPEDWLALCSAN